MSDPRVVLTLSTLVGAVVLIVAQRVIGKETPDYAFLVVPFGFSVAIWAPRDARDYALPVICGMLVLTESAVAACVVAFVIFALGQVVPGGATVSLLFVFALVGYFAAREAQRHLVRMRTARRLVPGERPRGDVEIGGRVVASRTISLPAAKSTCAAWWVETRGAQERSSDTPFEVRAKAGTVIVRRGRS